MAMIGIFILLVVTVLVNVLLPQNGVARNGTWIVTLILYSAMLVTAGYGVKKRWDGIFIDRDNLISLSRLQLVVWTVVLLSALFTAGLTNAVIGHAPNPLNIDIPPQIWGLLGLGAFTAVAAPAIGDGKRVGAAVRPEGEAVLSHRQKVAQAVTDEQNLRTPASFDGRMLTKANAEDARWIDLIMGDYEGAAHVDVSKLQKLAITVLIVVVYANGLWQLLAGTAVIQKFPPVHEGLLALLAISHAAYLADKQMGST